MIRTKPFSAGYLPEGGLVIGNRILGLLEEPFDPSVLKKRVLRTTKDKSKGEAAYYIDTRDLARRLDLVVGSTGWENDFQIQDLGDRVSVIADLTIGGIRRSGEAEELKIVERWDSASNGFKEKTNELVVFKAGPSALKRAAVHFGVGAYLYNFKDVNTWEPIDQWRNFSSPQIDRSKLPKWAVPRPGPTLVVHEIAYRLFLPEKALDQYSEEEMTAIKDELQSCFGLTTLHNFEDPDDYMRLAGCLARISDAEDAGNVSDFEDNRAVHSTALAS